MCDEFKWWKFNFRTICTENPLSTARVRLIPAFAHAIFSFCDAWLLPRLFFTYRSRGQNNRCVSLVTMGTPLTQPWLDRRRRRGWSWTLSLLHRDTSGRCQSRQWSLFGTSVETRQPCYHMTPPLWNRCRNQTTQHHNESRLLDP